MESYDAMLFRKADEYMSAGSGPSGDYKTTIFRDLGGDGVDAELTVVCSVSEGRHVDSAVITRIDEDGVKFDVPKWPIELTDDESEGIAADYWMRCDEDKYDGGGEW